MDRTKAGDQTVSSPREDTIRTLKPVPRLFVHSAPKPDLTSINTPPLDASTFVDESSAMGHVVMTPQEPVDFFVAPKTHGAASAHAAWLIYRRSLIACVDAASDVDTALQKAVKLAQFCAAGGKSSQVHMRESADAQWRTVWCDPEEARRFP